MNRRMLLLAGVLSLLCPHSIVTAAAPSPLPVTDATLQNHTTPLPLLLKKLQQRYKVSFIYEENLLKGKSCTCDAAQVKPADLEQYVNTILAQLQLRLRKFNSHTYAVISADDPAAEPATPSQPAETGKNRQLEALNTPAPANVYAANDALQQQFIISGRIVAEENEEPLPGATVLIKGTGIGTTADEEGNFLLKSPVAKILVIKHIGYEPKELTLGDKKTHLIIRLTGKSKTLTDVVVTGVYKRPVENFTGSAKTITAEELQRVSPQNILAAISVLDPSFQMPENIK